MDEMVSLSGFSQVGFMVVLVGVALLQVGPLEGGKQISTLSPLHDENKKQEICPLISALVITLHRGGGLDGKPTRTPLK